MIIKDEKPSIVPYSEVLRVEDRLKRVWNDRKTTALLEKIDHIPVRKSILGNSVISKVSCITCSPQVSPPSQTLENLYGIRQPISYSVEKNLSFQHRASTDCHACEDNYLVVNSDIQKAMPTPILFLRQSFVSPPTNSIYEVKGGPYEASDIAHLRLRGGRLPLSSTSQSSAKSKPILQQRPHVCSIPSTYSPSRKLLSPPRKQNIQASTSINHAADLNCGNVLDQHTKPIKDDWSKRAVNTEKENSAGSVTRTQRVTQYAPSPAKSPLARSQALLPFNLRRTSAQFRKEIMALGPPPEIKPMVMTDTNSRPRIDPSKYDLKTHGTANLLKFDKLEFRLHRMPSADLDLVTGSFHSNGTFSKLGTSRSHPSRVSDIANKNMEIADPDSILSYPTSEMSRDIPFFKLLDVR